MTPRKTVSLPITLSMCPPAVRMLAVECWACRASSWATTTGPDALGDWDDEETDHCFHPTLALVAGQGHEFTRPADGGRHRIAPTPEGLKTLGWHYEGAETYDLDAIILSADYGLCPASIALEGVNVVHRLVLAPWPPEEDEARLASVVAELRAEARAKVEGAARRKEPALATG